MNDLLYTLIVMYSGLSPDGTITMDAVLNFDGFTSVQECQEAGAALEIGLADPTVLTFKYECVELRVKPNDFQCEADNACARI